MKVLVYLVVPVLIVAVWSTAMWARNRKPTSLQSGVDDFRREMNALSPDPLPDARRSAAGRPPSRPRGQGPGPSPAPRKAPPSAKGH
ncbi:MAG: hypothetical protein JWN46_2115 [Acidimicrobiales bacterium]|nr:hypothetical protein [Acidimicrobiales bacterium]